MTRLSTTEYDSMTALVADHVARNLTALALDPVEDVDGVLDQFEGEVLDVDVEIYSEWDVLDQWLHNCRAA